MNPPFPSTMIPPLARLAFAFICLLPWLSFAFAAPDSPILAGPLGKDCIKGWKHSGSAKGKNVTIAGVSTYLVEPTIRPGPKKVIFFYSDVFGSFYINNQLLQDYFAEQGDTLDPLHLRAQLIILSGQDTTFWDWTTSSEIQLVFMWTRIFNPSILTSTWQLGCRSPGNKLHKLSPSGTRLS